MTPRVLYILQIISFASILKENLLFSKVFATSQYRDIPKIRVPNSGMQKKDFCLLNEWLTKYISANYKIRVWYD